MTYEERRRRRGPRRRGGRAGGDARALSARPAALPTAATAPITQGSAPLTVRNLQQCVLHLHGAFSVEKPVQQPPPPFKPASGPSNCQVLQWESAQQAAAHAAAVAGQPLSKHRQPFSRHRQPFSKHYLRWRPRLRLAHGSCCRWHSQETLKTGRPEGEQQGFTGGIHSRDPYVQQFGAAMLMLLILRWSGGPGIVHDCWKPPLFLASLATCCVPIDLPTEALQDQQHEIT